MPRFLILFLIWTVSCLCGLQTVPQSLMIHIAAAKAVLFFYLGGSCVETIPGKMRKSCAGISKYHTCGKNFVLRGGAVCIGVALLLYRAWRYHECIDLSGGNCHGVCTALSGVAFRTALFHLLQSVCRVLYRGRFHFRLGI